MSSRSHGDLLKMFMPSIVLALFAAAVAVAGQVPSPAPAGNVENGKKLFVKNGCAECHGLEGQGAPTSGPRIGPNPLPVAAFLKYVRAPKNQMPPYTGKVMSDQELTDVRAFLAALPKPAAATVLSP
jgi:ubiquinol-cytochrome c reductase cytochrome c subunit